MERERKANKSNRRQRTNGAEATRSGRFDSDVRGAKVVLQRLPENAVGGAMVFPQRLRRTFTTSGVEQLAGSGVTGIPFLTTVSLNSLYDPSYGLGGGSPRYFYTLVGSNATTAPYSRYCVVSARLKVKFINEVSTAAGLGDVGLFVRNENTSTLDNANEMYESENTLCDTLGSGYSGQGIRTMCINVPQSMMTRLQNCKDLEDSDENRGTYNSDPTTEVVCDLMWSPYVGSATTIQVRWTLEQDAILMGLNDEASASPGPASATPAAKQKRKCGSPPMPTALNAVVPVNVPAQHVEHGCRCSRA